MRVGSLVHLYLLGRWDEAMTIAAEERPIAVSINSRSELLTVAMIHCWRGELADARALVAAESDLPTSANPQAASAAALFEAFVRRAEGAPADALTAAERGFAYLGELTITETGIKLCLIEAIESALALGDLGKAAELLAVPESLDPGDMTPLLEANALRLRARLDAARGDQAQVDARFRSAAARCREFDLPVYLALAQLEHADWLEAQGRAGEAEPLLSEAGATFELLGAEPWLERTRRTSASAAGAVSSAITSNQT
jgi:ATP/maltotriose-dependent transcriptional regulator MalT